MGSSAASPPDRPSVDFRRRDVERRHLASQYRQRNGESGPEVAKRGGHGDQPRTLEGALLSAIGAALQLPSTVAHEVGPSPFPAISKLASGFSLVNPQDLTRKMVARDLGTGTSIHASVAIREIVLAGYVQATGHDDTAWRRRQRSEAGRFAGATAGCGPTRENLAHRLELADSKRRSRTQILDRTAHCRGLWIVLRSGRSGISLRLPATARPTPCALPLDQTREQGQVLRCE
jgi:hypothetical protein